MLIPIAKVDAEKRLVIGRAAQEVPDRAGEIMDYATARPAFQKWSDEQAAASDGKSKGNLRAMHGAIAAGKVAEIAYDDDAKAIDIVAKVTDDGEWAKVLDGVYTGFSVGGKYTKRWKDGDLTRYTPAVSEISLVDRPCVPTAQFAELVKADGSTGQLLLKGFPMTATVDDVLDALTKADSDTLVEVRDLLAKKAFSDEKRKKLAESGAALPDGSFPIENKDDLRNAIKAYGRAKNKVKVKAHIEARAKALGSKDLIPEGWDKCDGAAQKAEALGDLRKYLGEEVWDATRAMNALQIITGLLGDELAEAQAGDPEPAEQIAALRDAIERIKAFIVSEIQENHDDTVPAADADAALAAAEPVGALQKADLDQIRAVVAEALAAGKPAEPKPEEIAKTDGADDLAKAVDAAKAEALAKVEADTIQPLVKALGLAEGANLVEAVTKLAADHAELLAKKAEWEAAPAQPKGLVKVVTKGDDATPGSEDSLAKLAAEIDALPENQRAVAMIKAVQTFGGQRATT